MSFLVLITPVCVKTAPVHVHMCWPIIIHACCDHCKTPYSWPHFRQARILTTRRISILTATVQCEIKSTDPWYRPYDDSVIPRYIIYDNLVIQIIYDNLVIARYMTILLYRVIWWSCYTAVYDDLVILQ